MIRMRGGRGGEAMISLCCSEPSVQGAGEGGDWEVRNRVVVMDSKRRRRRLNGGGLLVGLREFLVISRENESTYKIEFVNQGGRSLCI